MLLPFRWLLYQLTGAQPPVEEQHADSGGLLKKPFIDFRRSVRVQLTGVAANPQIGDIESAPTNYGFGVGARPRVGAIALDIVVSAPKRRGRPKRTKTAIGNGILEIDFALIGVAAQVFIGTPRTRAVIDLTEDELMMLLLASSQFSAKTKRGRHVILLLMKKRPGVDVETATMSLIAAKRRVDQALAEANAANEFMFQAILEIDPEEFYDIDDRIGAEFKIANAETDCERAWERYEKALIRYNWECQEAKRLGAIA